MCFIGVFNDVGDICMINSILRKHKNHKIPQRRAYRLGKGYVEVGLKAVF